ncbi:M20 family metallo-hydrolase [Meiothermus hypogaeus]|uniref:Zn-dependent hydrolase n=2 Tax=Meiothermus hypogaeus TaxID=884155 RepID=A0A511QZS4_9DEIN|nr:M20 family metallo-hydrolase [Meiothermus hypogaeus]RIH77064.1 putative hydrolase [Meiothermus hypogaeus]GEM82879.1 Zn-dependent hydrolase [Meiothermus hypogaeus NBRC 106114]GIW37043.1 MAG: Zn-dependent hydrolase [Meiothermus sp.]
MIVRPLVDKDRIIHELDTLAGFSDTPKPAITRILFTKPDLGARAYLKGLCEEAGLRVREDGLGNIFARWEGSAPELPAVATGSHFDAIPYAGMYDGTVGVLGGLEAIRALQRSGFKPYRSIELLIFTAEEPTRFGIGCLGSRALAGVLNPESLRLLKDQEGKSLEEVRWEAGYMGRLEDVQLPEGYYAAFVELHIEQGPVLEQEHVPLGIVTAIAAPASLRVGLEGVGGHAGAMLMPDRHDALCAAAEIILGVEAFAKNSGSINTVATTGFCEVYPNAVNSVPSRVKLEIDVRDVEQSRRDQVIRNIIQGVEQVCTRREIKYSVDIINIDPPAKSGSEVLKALVEACGDAGVKFKLMVSRAYHDSLFMARIAPTAMLFIPCREGVSHRPDEYASPEDIALGTYVLALTLAKLSLAEGRGSGKEEPMMLSD